MSETEDTLRLADAILDRRWADPDDDLAMLSRQFLRAHEALAAKDAEIARLRERERNRHAEFKALCEERDRLATALADLGSPEPVMAPNDRQA